MERHAVAVAATVMTGAGLGIIGAMREELAAVLDHIPDAHNEHAAGRDFHAGHWHGRPVVAVLSRIGKVAAASTATALIERYSVSAIVFTGVAGGLKPGVNIGDVVVARDFLQHDLDASPLFPRHEVPLYGLARFPADARLAGLLTDAATQALADPARLLGTAAVRAFGLTHPAVHQGLVISGDQFIATGAASAALRAALPDALAVEMEGAAIAQVCHDYGVPFAAARTISDRADDTAHVDFTGFTCQVASHYSAAIVDALVRALPPLRGN
jgi:adenosylhomocysteine nucleosidase